jgi:alkaline phosphatase
MLFLHNKHTPKALFFPIHLLWLLLILSACKPAKIYYQTFTAFPATTSEVPQNVILLIGDGMGLAQIHAAMLSATDPLNIESAPFMGLVQTSSADNLITDSGAGGTALACGVKTFNGAIGVGVDSLPVTSILEQAARKGLSTGLVVSCNLTHATPAAFYAHRVSRSMDSAISTDFYGKNITIALGGGHGIFNQEQLLSEGYEVRTGISSINAFQGDKLVGFYNKSNSHPPRYDKGRKDWLPDATEVALRTLSKNEKGFFLMIEGSQIDWAGHDNDVDFSIQETLDFDRTLGKVLSFAAAHGNTLVIVTADHETGALSILNQPDDPLQMKAYYASKNHSAILVPLFAWGPAASLFSGFQDNTDVPKKIQQVLKLQQP